MAAYNMEQYQALTAAIATGALKVDYGDKKVEYRNLDAMLSLQNIMAKDLGLITDAGQRRLADFRR